MFERSRTVSGPGNLIAEIAHAVEMMIVDGELAGGDKLSEKSLVERFGVSRGTAREALRKLESFGLIDIRDNRGASVRRHSLKEVLDIFDLRCELTAYAARQVAEHGEPATIAALENLVAAMEDTLRRDDNKAYYLQNMAFHETLMEGSGNSRACALYAALVREAHLHRPMQLSTAAAMQRSHREHGAILDALRQGNARQAEQLARTHVANGKMRYIAAYGRSAE